MTCYGLHSLICSRLLPWRAYGALALQKDLSREESVMFKQLGVVDLSNALEM